MSANLPWTRLSLRVWWSFPYPSGGLVSGVSEGAWKGSPGESPMGGFEAPAQSVAGHLRHFAAPTQRIGECPKDQDKDLTKDQD